MTDGIGDAHRPAFSSDGSALYFLGSTNAGKAKTGLDLSVLAHMNDVSWSIYKVHLSGGGIERLPIPAARYVDLKVAADGALFLTEDRGERRFAGKRRLARFDPGTQKSEPSSRRRRRARALRERKEDPVSLRFRLGHRSDRRNSRGGCGKDRPREPRGFDRSAGGVASDLPGRLAGAERLLLRRETPRRRLGSDARALRSLASRPAPPFRSELCPFAAGRRACQQPHRGGKPSRGARGERAAVYRWSPRGGLRGRQRPLQGQADRARVLLGRSFGASRDARSRNPRRRLHSRGERPRASPARKHLLVLRGYGRKTGDASREHRADP